MIERAQAGDGDSFAAREEPITIQALTPAPRSATLPCESDEDRIKKLLVWMVGIALIVGSLLSIIIPPMKSPDEADHLRRAYLLTKGQWLLSSGSCTTPNRDCQKGQLMSGGKIDTGLNDYLVLRDFQNASEFRVNEIDEQQARAIRWSRQEAFSSAPGTGYYFPLIYVPQAVGLALGKALDLRIQTSYYLTRFVSLLGSLLILALAFWIWRPSAVVLALLVLPMSIFQGVSASLDGFSNALTILALSCFLRFVHQRGRYEHRLFLLMAAAILLVVTARAHLAPLVILLFAASYIGRRKFSWLISVGVVLAILLWMGLAISSTVDLRLERGASTGEVLLYYLKSPLQLLRVLWNTFSHPEILPAYSKGFLGQFFKVFLSDAAYYALACLLGIILVSSLASWRQFREMALVRVSLIVAGMASACLALLSMLLTWTPHPAEFIKGVQGRYFWGPVLLCFVGLVTWQPSVFLRRRVLTSALVLLASLGFLASVDQMLRGFYTPWMSVERPPAGRMIPSPKLLQEQPLVLRLDKRLQEFEVSRLGIFFATYQSLLRGKAVLRLQTVEGALMEFPVDLSDVRDNQYFYMDVPKGRYLGGEMTVESGEGGASVWEYHADNMDGTMSSDKGWSSCLIAMQPSGGLLFTSGCPVPK